MAQRILIALGGLAAAAVLAFGLVAAGFGPAGQSVPVEPTLSGTTNGGAVEPATVETVVVVPGVAAATLAATGPAVPVRNLLAGSALEEDMQAAAGASEHDYWEYEDDEDD